jgi:hypothetical protein
MVTVASLTGGDPAPLEHDTQITTTIAGNKNRVSFCMNELSRVPRQLASPTRKNARFQRHFVTQASNRRLHSSTHFSLPEHATPHIWRVPMQIVAQWESGAGSALLTTFADPIGRDGESGVGVFGKATES